MDDEKIVGLFFSRSELAIAELDAKYGRLLHKLAYGILQSREDAEECVNDAYLGAWNAIPPAHPRPLLAYIARLVRNLSLKAYYRREAAKRGSAYSVAINELEEVLASPDTVESSVEARELAGIIQDFLDTLSEENRIIFLRRYWFSDSYSEIAVRVGLTEKTVSVRLTRVRKKLKNYLIEREVLI